MHLKPKDKIFIELLILAFVLLSISSSFAESVTYTYDNTNRLIWAEYEDGTAVNYLYDEVGNLISRDVTYYSISVTPTSYDFGSIYVGDISTSNAFTVENMGAANVFINSITLSGADSSQFNIQTNTCSGQTLITSASCTVQVVFTPASEGTKNTNLSISLSNPDTHTYAVPLSGTGSLTLRPVRTLHIPPVYYSSIQAAYDSAVDGDVIQCQAIDFTEDLTINRNISVTLKGGYNADYSSDALSTSIIGKLRGANGTLQLESIVFK
jgi:hypothetical protein